MVHIKKLVIPALILMVIAIGCERQGENIPTMAPTAASYVQNGWDYYKAGNYQAALEAFNASKARDAIKQDSYNGLGWTYAKLQNYDKSISNFILLLAITDNETYIQDAYAGLAMTYGALNLITTDDEEVKAEAASEAFKYADLIINRNPNYVFSHDENINITTIHAMIAQIYFNSQDFLNALYEVEAYLKPGFKDELINNSIISLEVDTVIAKTIPTTPFNGTTPLKLEQGHIVEILSVKNIDTSVNYSVVEFDQGGIDFTIIGNPVPQDDDQFIVEFYNAPDYGKFLNELINTIVEYQ